MKIASLVLSVRPERRIELRDELGSIAGVQVHRELPGSKLVITVEDVPGHDLMHSILAAQSLPGVLSTTLAYEYCDDELDSLEKRP